MGLHVCLMIGVWDFVGLYGFIGIIEGRDFVYAWYFTLDSPCCSMGLHVCLMIGVWDFVGLYGFIGIIEGRDFHHSQLHS
jgi:hypothetical protein